MSAPQSERPARDSNARLVSKNVLDGSIKTSDTRKRHFTQISFLISWLFTVVVVQRLAEITTLLLHTRSTMSFQSRDQMCLKPWPVQIGTLIRRSFRVFSTKPHHSPSQDVACSFTQNAGLFYSITRDTSFLTSVGST